jgi:hypothetical protein
LSGAALIALFALGQAVVAGCGGGEAENKGAASPAASTTSVQVRDETIVHEACNESGHQAQKLDTNGDGKYDIVRVSDGNTPVCIASDMNHDGKPDMYEYFDKSGQVRRREIDFDDNGVANVIEHYENGKMTSRELDTTNQGRIDTWDTFDPATGKIVKRERDSTNDGRIDQWWTYEGDKVTIAMDRNGDGLPDPDATVVMGGDNGPAAKGDAGAAPAAALDGGAAAPPSPPVTPVVPTPAPAATDAVDAGGAKTTSKGKGATK